jgi:hypothetical protein
MTQIEHDRAEKALWRMATIKIILFSVLALLTCWMTATNGLDMPKLGVWEWIQLIIGCISAWFVTLIAFIDKSAAQVSSGRIPGLENGKVEEPTPTPATPAPTGP